MRTTFVVRVEDRGETLMRVVSLLHRLALKVDSLVFGGTEVPRECSIAISLDTEPNKAQRIAAQLNKIVDVLDVEIIEASEAGSRSDSK